MDSSFWYSLLVALLGFFGVEPASVQMPAWLQQGADWVREHNRMQVQAGAAAHVSARVTAVPDGDTIRVTDSHGQSRRVRLAYIDAPELAQAGGMASRDALRGLVSGQDVQITVFEQDQYRRDVAQVFVAGRDVGLAQIENGHAWHYAAYAKRSQSNVDYAEYAYAEAVARRQRQGVWQAGNSQAPWAYRREQRNGTEHSGKSAP